MMIRHLKARMLASAITLLVVLHPHAGYAQTVPAPAPTPAFRVDPIATVTSHISIVTAGPTAGAPIVLIPGLSSPRAVWDGVVPELAKTHRVHLVQVNGFGGEDPRANLQPGILDGIVADLDDYIARNKIKNPAIVGHSMGGLVGLMFARAHPAHVGKLMIVDSLPFYGMLFGPTATVAMVEPQGKAMRDALVATYGKPADPAAADKIANFLAAKPDSRIRVKAWVMAADPRISGAAMYEDLTTDLRPDLAAIQTPITLVYPWGGAGPTRERADALYRGAYAAAPHMTYVAIGEAAHFVMLDQPAAFAAAMAGFVAGN